MADKLAVYNLTLAHLRQRRIGSLTEASEARRVLDDLWNQVVAEALAEALWNFMVRAVQQDASSTVTPAFGWKYAFELPNDWVRTVLVSTVETFNPPLLEYAEETGFWFANFTPLFVRYVSSDPVYGMNLGAWPANFTAWVALHLAEYACGRVAGPAGDALLDGPNGIVKRAYKAKVKAKSTDAMNQPPGEMPTGTWARSRRGFLHGLPAPGGDMFDD